MRRGALWAVIAGAILIALILTAVVVSQVSPQSAGVVLHFTASNVQRENLATRAAAIADEPYVGRIRFSEKEEEGRASGVLLFDSLDSFVGWRETRMAEFFNALGPAATVQSIRIMRPEELRASGGDELLGIGDVNIQYRNTENDADGDADIDAVTVICGDGADCEPSN